MEGLIHQGLLIRLPYAIYLPFTMKVRNSGVAYTKGYHLRLSRLLRFRLLSINGMQGMREPSSCFPHVSRKESEGLDLRHVL